MGRKKKPTRKFKPRNEFRKNHSPATIGHPNYIFGETKTKYKSFGLTSSPREEERCIKLSKNPNPNNTNDSYLKLKVFTSKKSYVEDTPLEGWAFAKEDMPIVRHFIKKYKKSTNRNKQRNKKKDKSA